MKIIFKLWSMEETFRENFGGHFKNSNIVFWKDIFLLSEKILLFPKNFQKIIKTKFKNFFVII